MADYLNLFTTVQATGPVQHGEPLGPGNSPRTGHPGVSWLLGKIGNAQIGPIYLGGLGLASLICGLIAFNIIGMNMLASVNYDPVQFVRQLLQTLAHDLVVVTPSGVHRNHCLLRLLQTRPFVLDKAVCVSH